MAFRTPCAKCRTKTSDAFYIGKSFIDTVLLISTLCFKATLDYSPPRITEAFVFIGEHLADFRSIDDHFPVIRDGRRGDESEKRCQHVIKASGGNEICAPAELLNLRAFDIETYGTLSLDRTILL